MFVMQNMHIEYTTPAPPHHDHALQEAHHSQRRDPERDG